MNEDVRSETKGVRTTVRVTVLVLMILVVLFFAIGVAMTLWNALF